MIHGIKRKPHLSVAWNWYHFVAIPNLHQRRPTYSAHINPRLQLSDTSSTPPMHGGFLLRSYELSKKFRRHVCTRSYRRPQALFCNVVPPYPPEQSLFYHQFPLEQELKLALAGHINTTR